MLLKLPKKEKWYLDKIVFIEGNTVKVQLREKGAENSLGSYSFFNDVNVKANFDTTNNKGYYFVIGEK